MIFMRKSVVLGLRPRSRACMFSIEVPFVLPSYILQLLSMPSLPNIALHLFSKDDKEL